MGVGGDRAAEAARHLEALLGPLRFAAHAGFAALPRLAGFEDTLRGAAARARAAGAPDSAALRGLEAEARGFDALGQPEKRRALARVAGHLSALIPLPEELRQLAALGRVEVRAPLSPALSRSRSAGEGERCPAAVVSRSTPVSASSPSSPPPPAGG